MVEKLNGFNRLIEEEKVNFLSLFNQNKRK